MDIPKKGKIAIRQSGPPNDPERKHPTVFVTEPFFYEPMNGQECVIIIPISSIKPKKDPKDRTCLINGGEHEFIPKI